MFIMVASSALSRRSSLYTTLIFLNPSFPFRADIIKATAAMTYDLPEPGFIETMTLLFFLERSRPVTTVATAYWMLVGAELVKRRNPFSFQI